MRKLFTVFAIVLFLAPLLGAKELTGFSVKAGGALLGLQASQENSFERLLYQSSYYGDEYLEMTETIAGGLGLGFAMELGYSINPSLEITANFGFGSKNLVADYYLNAPSRYYWRDFANDAVSTTAAFKATIIGLGVNFYPMTNGALSPYLGGGLAFFSASLQLAENVNYKDEYYYDHTIEITDVDFQEVTMSRVAPFFRGGFKAIINPTIGFYVEAAFYLAGTAEVQHPAKMDVPFYTSARKFEAPLVKVGLNTFALSGGLVLSF